MKTAGKRILAIALCAALVFGVLSVSTLAVDTDAYAGVAYDCYTYLGDSISWGYGLDPTVDNHDKFNIGRRVENSFTDLVADVLQQNNPDADIHPAACSGARLCDYRILLERGMGVENPYNRENDWYGNRHPERTETLRTLGPQICGYLRKSDLVTVQLGINDLTAALVNALYATGLVDLNKLSDISDFNSAMEYLKFALGNLKDSPDVLGNLVRTFNSELAGIRENAAEVVKDVATLAPDADILVIGYHKAAAGIRVIPGTDFSPIFDLIDAALVSLNDYFALVASDYSNVYYVDAPDAAVFYPDGTTLLDALKNIDGVLMGIHPDAEGHAYIAERVLDALQELHTCHHTNTACVNVRLLCGGKYVGTEVCTDCGKILNASKVVTPSGNVIPTPAYTINNAVNTVTNAVYQTANRLTFGLLSKIGN